MPLFSRRKFPDIKVDNVDEKTLCDVLTDHKDFKLSNEQKRGYFEVRNNINCTLKNRANNVKVVIYIDNAYIQIIAGKAENHINIYINSDASVKKEWREENDDLEYEIDVEKVNAKSVHDEMQKFTHKFEGAEKQKQGFYNVREKINGLVGFFSDNIRLSLIVDDILPKPIVFKAGKEENQLCIFIKSDGTLYWEWEKRTWKKKFFDFFRHVFSSETFHRIAQDLIRIFAPRVVVGG